MTITECSGRVSIADSASLADLMRRSPIIAKHAWPDVLALVAEMADDREAVAA